MEIKTKKSLFIELENKDEIEFLKDMVEEFQTNKGSKQDEFKTELLYLLNLKMNEDK